MNFKDSKPPRPLRNIANLSKLFKTSSTSPCSQSLLKQLPKQSRPIMQYCNNHPTTPSTHKIQEEDETLYYCDKCSELLQKQGFQTSPLRNSYQSKIFIDKLAHSLSQIHNRKSQNLLKHDKVLFNYQKTVKKIKGYKESILRKIEDLFQSQLKNAHQNVMRQVREIESQKEYLNSYEKQMKSMIKDIEENINGIDRLPSKSFVSAMAQYTAVLTKYQTQSSKINSKHPHPNTTPSPNPNPNPNLNPPAFNSFNPTHPPQFQPMQESLTINQNTDLNNLDNMLFSLSDTLKGLSYEGTLFSDKIRMVQSMHHDPDQDMSLTQESIVEYRETSRIDSLF